MKLALLLPLAAFFFIPPSSARALDCGKASSPVEKLLCKTPALKRADDAMSAAYFKLLRETKDPEFHEALLRSQRRWLEARAEAFKPDRPQQEDDETNALPKILLQATRDRLKFLQTATPLRAMEGQRKAVSKDSGGAFAGYRARCTFLPPSRGSSTYTCLGEAHRQHNGRICSAGVDWASGHTTDYRLVTVLKNGAPQAVASCSIGYAATSEQCPYPDDDAETKALSHWNTNPNPQPTDTLPVPYTGGLWKYDPEIALDVADKWMDECLFATVFPPPEVSRPDTISAKRR